MVAVTLLLKSRNVIDIQYLVYDIENIISYYTSIFKNKYTYTHTVEQYIIDRIYAYYIVYRIYRYICIYIDRYIYIYTYAQMYAIYIYIYAITMV